MKIKLICFTLIGVVIIVILSSIFIVNQTQQALILRFGKSIRIITDSGLHLKYPLIDQVVFFDKRILDYDGASQEIPTSDQKQVVVDAFSKFQIINILRFYQSVRTSDAMRARLDALVNSALRAIIGQVPLSSIMTNKRTQFMQEVTARVSKRAAEFGVHVIDVRIKRIDLPEENSQAIFRRMQTQREQAAILFRAEGEAQARRIRADADKKQRIILATAQKQSDILKGEGEAEAQKMYNTAFSHNAHFFIFWRSLTALKKALNHEHTVFVITPHGTLFKYFNGFTGEK